MVYLQLEIPSFLPTRHMTPSSRMIPTSMSRMHTNLTISPYSSRFGPEPTMTKQDYKCFPIFPQTMTIVRTGIGPSSQRKWMMTQQAQYNIFLLESGSYR